MRLREIKRQMRKAGISQRAVAEALGITHFAVCHALAGRLKSRRILAKAEELIRERLSPNADTVSPQ